MTNELSSYTDAQLIKLYQEKQNALYIGELYKRYSLSVFGLCYKYLKNKEDAKDAVIDIFEVILEKLKLYEVTFFKSWLYSVSRNQLVKKLNKNNSLETIELSGITEKSIEKFVENEPETTLYIRERESEYLVQALSNLNDDQRTCIELFYYQQKPYQEVASITGYDLNKVKSAIQNGKRNLKLFMEKKQLENGE